MKQKPKQKTYYKLIVDGKCVDIFPDSPFQHRRLLKLKGVALVLSNLPEYELFMIGRERTK